MHRRGRGRPAHPDVLTPAEWRVLDLWRHGLTRGEIARLQGVSGYAVRYHLRNITGKLGAAAPGELRHWPGFPATSPIRERSNPMTTRSLELGSLGQVSLYARDAARTEAWYRDVLGLPEVFRFGDLVFFWCGDVRLYIHAVEDERWRPSSVLYFLVDDIAAAHAELERRGVTLKGAPHMIYRDDTTGVEEWMAFFEDPDANVLALMSRVSPASNASA
ncbi:MAG TPA: VOC family protein [Candidatus Limnocylindrales bacterium]|nr:VOC family protein [Candidatus Limnocylindrales bacterium]